MRLAFDVTSLHGPRTGVGRFASEVLAGLAADERVAVTAYSASWRGRHDVADLVPPGVGVARRVMAAAPLRQLWRRVDWPPIEWWTGSVDVVHGPNFVVPPARRAAQLATVHDLTFLHFPDFVTADVAQYPALIRNAVRRGAHLHAVSAFVAGEITEVYGIDPDRVHVVANGITPPGAGDADAGRRLAGGERYVLALGTVEPRKDLPSLVAAFDRVAADDRDLRLVVAGPDGWGVDQFVAAVEGAAARRRIVRLGWVDEAQRADLLAGACLLAYPSRYEGFGLPPLEAMAAGVAVVASRAGALAETLGDAAVLVDPGDVDGLAAALAAVAGDDARRRDLAARGRAHAARYSWGRCAAELVALYDRLSNGR